MKDAIPGAAASAVHWPAAWIRLEHMVDIAVERHIQCKDKLRHRDLSFLPPRRPPRIGGDEAGYNLGLARRGKPGTVDQLQDEEIAQRKPLILCQNCLKSVQMSIFEAPPERSLICVYLLIAPLSRIIYHQTK